MNGVVRMGMMTCVLHSRVLRGLVVVSSLLLAGCATGPQANPTDPLEPFNRSVFKFNDGLDRNVFKPVATAYRDVTPVKVQTGVGNFFRNLEDMWSFVNNVLQFKGAAAGDTFFRVGVNTFIGLGGLLDVATEMRIERHTEDFGQTLGYWGMGPGPFIMIPVLGPSNLRDTAALPLDARAGDPVTYAGDKAAVYTLWALRATDQRAAYLKSEKVIEEGVLDRYIFIRDAYMQRRRNAVYDGEPPDEEPIEDADPSK